MDAHFVNSWDQGEGTVAAHGASLAVRQFVELVRGERKRILPSHPFRVAELRAEERYCLLCCAVYWHDVALDVAGQVVWKRCRFCGKEGRR